MRTCLIVLVALVGCQGCKKEPPSSGGGGSSRSAKDADALWALGPETAVAGYVLTPRALDHLDGAVVTLLDVVNKTPELAFVKARLDEVFQEKFGAPITSFADLGIDKTRGMAMFLLEDGDAAIAVPIGDRAKLGTWFGMDLGTDASKLGPLTCKPVHNVSVCAMKEGSLALLGKGKTPASITAIGARGDIEGYGGDGTIRGAGVAQLERGEVTVRGAVSGLPPAVTSRLGAAHKPRVETDRSVAFGVSNLDALNATLPAELPLPGGGTLGELLGSVAGPMTVTIAANTVVPDVRVPVNDPAPAQRLVDNCKELVPAEMLAPNQQPGVCRFIVPQYAAELDAWVDGKEIRIGSKAPLASSGKPPALSPLAKELAGGAWSIAFWGRGSMLGATGFPAMLGAQLPEEGAAVIRALTLLGEMGVGVRSEGDKLTGVFGFRTLFANPPDVVRKVLAVPPADVIAGKVDAAKAIAAGAPSSPFAGDFAAGQGGLMVPTAVIGMLAAIAIPAFMDYGKKSKVSEAQLRLNMMAKNLKVLATTEGKLPVGEVPPGPTCCGQPEHKCAPTPATWEAPIWKQIEFSVDEPALYRYGYKSTDGKTFEATAVGDLDCDGQEIIYRLQGTLDNTGQLTTALTAPPPNTD